MRNFDAIEGKTVLADADVISHFLTGNAVHLLQALFKDRLHLLDIVESELMKYPKLRTQVENLISFKIVKPYAFPTDNVQIAKEYLRLRKELGGDGESACLAVARFTESVVASSNLRDIRQYCQENGIVYLTTMDILVLAYESGLATEADCDYFIYQVKSQGSKLPQNTIREFMDKTK